MDELEGMKCLIAAEVGFKAAWKDLLQYAFLSRSKAATSNKYYELKKIMSPISPSSNVQKDVLRRKAFGKLFTCREDCFTHECGGDGRLVCQGLGPVSQVGRDLQADGQAEGTPAQMIRTRTRI